MRCNAGAGACIASKIPTDTSRANEYDAAKESALRCMRQATSATMENGKGKEEATQKAPGLAAHSIGGLEAGSESSASQLCGRNRRTENLNSRAFEAAKRHIGAAVS